MEELVLKKVDVAEQLLHTLAAHTLSGITAAQLAEALQIERSTASRYLNELVKAERAQKVVGRPVRYLPVDAGKRLQGERDVSVGLPRTPSAPIPARAESLQNSADPQQPLLDTRSTASDSEQQLHDSQHTRHNAQQMSSDQLSREVNPEGLQPPQQSKPKHDNNNSLLSKLSQAVIGAGESLKPVLEEALPALFYPPNGLPILLFGETGVGKSFLARKLYDIAVEQKRLKEAAPFVAFNCAEYAHNPELLMGQLFGVKKGAFTGATSDRIGLVERAHGGILFLDEIHRLPPSGQEMLFYLIDQGMFRRLGEASLERHASIRLIGATTELPQDVLLPTLYRRFSVKLTLPPLRKRTRSEREALLTHFLQHEATQMGVPLSISPESRAMLLSYTCPGNIGQLQSDVQIACARAFLRRLNHREQRVTITSRDIPSTVQSSGTSYSPSEERHATPVVETARIEANAETMPLPNVYELLTERERALHKRGAGPVQTAQALQEVVDEYVQTLFNTSRNQDGHVLDDMRLVNEQLLQTIREAATHINDDLPTPLTVHQIAAIALHTQNMLRRPGSSARYGDLPQIAPVSAAYQKAAQKLTAFLEHRLNVKLPARETDLLGLLLAPPAQHVTKTSRVAVLVVTHGDAAASSMADVTNALLGNAIIHAVDMPLSQSTSIAYRRIAKKIARIESGAGVLMLVDIGSLVSMGEALSQELGKPIKTLAHVNLPMVIEAGRKAMLPENDLQTVADSAAHVLRSPFAYFAQPFSASEEAGDDGEKDKQRLIATVCLTGEGAAVSLEDWLRKQLAESDTDADVLVRSVRIDPESRQSPLLEHLAKEYKLIAVVGTVPPNLEGVPYIPIWELLQSDGTARLERLLKRTRGPITAPRTASLQVADIPALIEQGLSETVQHFNPRSFCQLLANEMGPVRDHFGWEPERELGIWMHLGIVTDKLLQQQLTGSDQEQPTPPPLKKIDITETDIAVWRPVLARIAEQHEVTFPDDAAENMARLAK
ncbi:sigma 54-interacting transcriptional regulator [Numidum massiliense]|uniref:sigma 54-interacting transcriptional regulator n=1 Tax=Numidum massiliense TaxID=1522315 RepID=UPI0006D58D87|nr:sigma-54-dependent transcriptional regulator [Numidum massiliense]